MMVQQSVETVNAANYQASQNEARKTVPYVGSMIIFCAVKLHALVILIVYKLAMVGEWFINICE